MTLEGVVGPGLGSADTLQGKLNVQTKTALVNESW